MLIIELYSLKEKGFASHTAEWALWWLELSESGLSTAMGCRVLWASLSSAQCPKSWRGEFQHQSVSLQSRPPAELPFKICCWCWIVLGATERASCQARHVRCYDSAWSWFTHLLNSHTMNFFKMTPCLGKVRFRVSSDDIWLSFLQEKSCLMILLSPFSSSFSNKTGDEKGRAPSLADAFAALQIFETRWGKPTKPFPLLADWMRCQFVWTDYWICTLTVSTPGEKRKRKR